MLQIFNYQDREIRFVGTPEAPEWVASDVVEILYPDSTKENRSNTLKKIPEKWTGIKPINTRSENGVEQQRQVKTLLEPGLYQLIIRSNSPHAQPFQDWLFEEVLPAIRKTGSYAIKPEGDLDRALLTDLLQRVTRLETTIPTPKPPTENRSLTAAVIAHPNPQIPDIPTRRKVRALVTDYCSAHNKNYQHIYRDLYTQYELRYNYNVYARAAKAKTKNKLDQLEADGEIERFWELATAILSPVFA